MRGSLVALALVACLTGCGLLGPRPAEIAPILDRDLGLDTEGPVALIGQNAAVGWRALAARSAEQGSFCVVVLVDDGSRSGGCGEAHEWMLGPVSGTSVGAVGIVAGIVDREAAAVRLVHDGAPVEIGLVDLGTAGIDGLGFAHEVPAGAVVDIEVIDHEGVTVVRERAEAR